MRPRTGFEWLEDVISQDELGTIATDYKLTAGFDRAVLNDRPSLSVSTA